MSTRCTTHFRSTLRRGLLISAIGLTQYELFLQIWILMLYLQNPWCSPGNIPCCMQIALSFCCLPLVLEINIRDLLLQELKALFLVIELLHDNLPPWAIIKTGLILLPKWHLNMMQLPESYCYNYLLIAAKPIPIILLSFPLLWWKSTFLEKKKQQTKTNKTKQQNACERLPKSPSFFFLNGWPYPLNTIFFAFLQQGFCMYCLDIVVKFCSLKQIQIQSING